MTEEEPQKGLTLWVRLTPEMSAMVRQMAEKEDRTLSAVLRRMVRLGLEQEFRSRLAS